MTVHATDGGLRAAHVEGADLTQPDGERTCTPKQPRVVNATRRRYADVAAEVITAVLGADRGAWQAWADRLGLARQVTRRFGETDGARVTLGDVLAMPQDKAVAVLETLAQRLRGSQDGRALPVETRMHRVGAEVGDVHRAALVLLEQGGASPEKRRALAREAVEAGDELYALARDLSGGQ